MPLYFLNFAYKIIEHITKITIIIKIIFCLSPAYGSLEDKPVDSSSSFKLSFLIFDSSFSEFVSSFPESDSSFPERGQFHCVQE